MMFSVTPVDLRFVRSLAFVLNFGFANNLISSTVEEALIVIYQYQNLKYRPRK